jgi:hypothetical protein
MISSFGRCRLHLLLQVGVKTLTGRSVPRDPLQSADGWNKFTAGFAVGGLSGAAWGYICTWVAAPACTLLPPLFGSCWLLRLWPGRGGRGGGGQLRRKFSFYLMLTAYRFLLCSQILPYYS